MVGRFRPGEPGRPRRSHTREVTDATRDPLIARMRPFGTEAVGSFAAASGVLSLLCHFMLEPSVTLTPRDGALIFAMGIGPLGAAFYLWGAAIKSGASSPSQSRYCAGVRPP